MSFERPLSRFERYFMRSGRGANFTFTGFVSPTVPEGVWRQALNVVQRRHPALGVRMRESHPPRFTASDAPIPLRVVKREGETHWQRVVEQELNAPIAWADGPLLRAVLLPGVEASEIILCIHHGIADAYSGIFILRDLLHAMGLALTGAEVSLEPLPIRPPLLELLPATFRGMNGLPRLLAGLSATTSRCAGEPRRLPVEVEAQPGERSSKVSYRIIPSETRHALLERCRVERTSVLGALMAGAFRWLGRRLAAGAPSAPFVELGCIYSVDLRGRLEPVITDDVGLYFANLSMFLRLEGHEPFWELARRIREESLVAREHALAMAVLQHGSALEAPSGTEAGMNEGTHQAALVIGSGPELPIPQTYGPLRLEQLQLAVATHTSGTTPVLSSFTYRGRLLLSCSYSTPTVSQAQVDALLNGLLAELHAALAGPHEA